MPSLQGIEIAARAASACRPHGTLLPSVFSDLPTLAAARKDLLRCLRNCKKADPGFLPPGGGVVEPGSTGMIPRIGHQSNVTLQTKIVLRNASTLAETIRQRPTVK